MLNTNKQYFALIAQPNGTIKRIYPKTVYKSHYQGISMFSYQSKIGEYHVIECVTGLPIAVSKLSRNDALARSRHNIDTQGTEAILNDITIRKQCLDQITIYEEENYL